MKHILILFILLFACSKDNVAPVSRWSHSQTEIVNPPNYPLGTVIPPFSMEFSLRKDGNHYTVLSGGSFSIESRAYKTIEYKLDEIRPDGSFGVMLVNTNDLYSGGDYAKIEFIAIISNSSMSVSGVRLEEKINSKVTYSSPPNFVIWK